MLHRLKADFHTHSADDPYDNIGYSSEMLIDRAAQLNFDVLALVCHQGVVRLKRLDEYARRRGVLLLPAAELLVEGKHVVVLNPADDHIGISTFSELREADRSTCIVLAPHPFYPDSSCLGSLLERNIDLFDVVEYCSVYYPGLNPNRKAVQIARKYGLPMLGTSDVHMFPYAGSTFTWVEAEERSIESVISAVRAGRVTPETQPCSGKYIVRIGAYHLYCRFMFRTRG